MGESGRKRQGALIHCGGEAEQLQAVDTLGGRMHVGWDASAAATPHGQLVFFAEFLAATGVFERCVSACPLAYESGKAPDKRDVLGTLMLGLLADHRRYAHTAALRVDAVAAQALGMNKVISEDALRRALERIDEPASTACMRPALMHSVRQALSKPWVLDVDARIKPLYGRQEGAERGTGPEGTSPALVRGDSGYGNEGILLELESRGQLYLLRLRQTANVQRLVARQFARQDRSRPDNQGCQMVEDKLQPQGWSKLRRVAVVRQRTNGGIARERSADGRQLRLDLAGPSVHEGQRLWEYAGMVTDALHSCRPAPLWSRLAHIACKAPQSPTSAHRPSHPPEDRCHENLAPPHRPGASQRRPAAGLGATVRS